MKSFHSSSTATKIYRDRSIILGPTGNNLAVSVHFHLENISPRGPVASFAGQKWVRWYKSKRERENKALLWAKHVFSGGTSAESSPTPLNRNLPSSHHLASAKWALCTEKHCEKDFRSWPCLMFSTHHHPYCREISSQSHKPQKQAAYLGGCVCEHSGVHSLQG